MWACAIITPAERCSHESSCFGSLPWFITPCWFATLTTYVSGETQKSLEVCEQSKESKTSDRNVGVQTTGVLHIYAAKGCSLLSSAQRGLRPNLEKAVRL